MIARLCIILCLICFSACEEQKEELSDIRIGKEKGVEELLLNKQTEKRLLLSGGDGEYIVNIENAQVAIAYVSMDTLKVEGPLEGETFATIISHDKHTRLKISMVFPDLEVGHSAAQFLLEFKSKYVSILGGGELTKLEESDPADIMDIKWDGSTGTLEINPKYEGEAQAIAISKDAKEKKITHIKVRPEEELETSGWYGTNINLYYLILNNKTVVKRKGVGARIASSTRPYGGGGVTYSGSYIKLAPIVNPIQGDSVDLSTLRYESQRPQITEGIHRLFAEEVHKSEVMLRGRGFKFLLPYQK